MTSKLKALNDNIIVELPQQVDEQNKQNLIQLIGRHDRVVCSRVVAVGPGKQLDSGKIVPMEYKVGDIVYYPTECQTSAPRIKLKEAEYLSLVQPQVLCYIPAPSDEVAE